MSAKVNFTEFTNSRMLFANMTEANNWADALTVSSAATDAEGVVKKASAIVFAPAAINNVFVSINIIQADGSELPVEVVTKASYEALYAEFIKVSNAFTALINNMKSAGLLE